MELGEAIRNYHTTDIRLALCVHLRADPYTIQYHEEDLDKAREEVRNQLVRLAEIELEFPECRNFPGSGIDTDS